MQKTSITSVASIKDASPSLSAISLPVSHLEPLAKSWLIDGDCSNHSDKTLSLRRGVMTRFAWWCGWAEIKEIGADAVKQFLLYLRRGHEQHQEEGEGRWGDTLHTRCRKTASASTVSTYYRTLRTFFAWCVKEKVLPLSPMQDVKPPVNHADQVQPFTQEQVNALYAAAKKTGARDHALCLLLLDTGIRAGEVHALTISDVDLIANQVHIRHGKGNKSRTVPFSRDTKRALYEWRRIAELKLGLDSNDSAPFFLSLRGPNAGQGLNEYALGGIVEKWGKTAKISGVRCSPHTFRHTFAISFLRLGGNVFSLQTMLGHTDLKMTSRYVAIAQADINRQHAQFSPVAALRKGGAR